MKGNLLTLKMEALRSAEASATTSPHNLTSKKACIFINAAVRIQKINPICSWCQLTRISDRWNSGRGFESKPGNGWTSAIVSFAFLLSSVRKNFLTRQCLDKSHDTLTLKGIWRRYMATVKTSMLSRGVHHPGGWVFLRLQFKRGNGCVP